MNAIAPGFGPGHEKEEHPKRLLVAEDERDLNRLLQKVLT